MRKKQIDIRAAVLAAMKAKGWTAYRLGQESGIAPSDVARWLDDSRADHQPHITTKRLEPILTALGLEIKERFEKR
jgi:hypothetical protein